jgi:hypothetical protein
MIFISYQHDGYITSIISASNEKLALAYWQGAGIDVHTHKCVENPEDFIPLAEHPTGVIPILKTKEVKAHTINTRNLDTTLILVSK